MSHPSLGLPPVDRTVGLPPVAARAHANRERVAIRALEIAIDRDPTLRERYDEIGMRRFLRDSAVLVDRVVEALADGNPERAIVFAEAVPPMYRRRKVPMDDLVNLAEGVRAAVGAILPRQEMGLVDTTIDGMIERFRWHRRIAGDARKRNPVLAFIYKGA